jgi:hypothetical protein
MTEREEEVIELEELGVANLSSKRKKNRGIKQ